MTMMTTMMILVTIMTIVMFSHYMRVPHFGDNLVRKGSSKKTRHERELCERGGHSLFAMVLSCRKKIRKKSNM